MNPKTLVRHRSGANALRDRTAAAYAIPTQALAHRELGLRSVGRCVSDCAQIIGGVMLILGMALGLTNFLIDAGIPDAAIEWTQSVIPNKFVFLLALTAFLFLVGALMEIFAAIVVLVPLLLPVAVSYGIDPVHFGIISFWRRWKWVSSVRQLG